jgi:hypothetical protein
MIGIPRVSTPPQVLHCTWLRSKPTSWRNRMAIGWSVNRNVRNNLFGPPSSLNSPRPYENLGKCCILRRRCSYSLTTSFKRAAIVTTTETLHKWNNVTFTAKVRYFYRLLLLRRLLWVALWVLKGKPETREALWVENEIRKTRSRGTTTTAAPHVSVSEMLQSLFCIVAWML